MSKAGVLPDHGTLPNTIKAAGKVYSLETIHQLHKVVIGRGFENDGYVGSGLIKAYLKLGDYWDAYKVFDGKMNCWNAIIAGISQIGRSMEAVKMFLMMRRSGLEPNEVTMSTVATACGGLGDLKLALQLHKCVVQVKWKAKEEIPLMNSVVDMYVKCGRMDLANRVFSEMNRRNIWAWTSMIVAYASHGQANEAMEVFHAMIKAGARPNGVTFCGVLSACMRGGMVDEGIRCFEMMKNDYGIQPNMKHYGCMANLLGRAGLLEEARYMVEGMPMKPNEVIWGCLMVASLRYDDVRMGEWVATHYLQLQPWNDSIYGALLRIYASREMWEEVENITKRRRLAKLQIYT